MTSGSYLVPSSHSPDNYFSLEDILASQERVPITIMQDLPKLGFLDPSSVHQTDPTNLAAGSKLELPLWMAKALKGRRRIQVELPETWTPSQRQIINADPNVVDLHMLGPDFYQSGLHVLKLISDGQNLESEAEEVGNVLVDTLTRRFRGIMDASANAEARDTLVNTGTFDVSLLFAVFNSLTCIDSFSYHTPLLVLFYFFLF